MLVCVAWAHTARAQTPVNDFERSRFNTAAYYSYSEPGDVTMLVNVWGTVRNPGLYEVPKGTHLGTVLSVAGGPAVTPRYKREERTVVVRLFREVDGQRKLIHETKMEGEIYASTEDPELQEGDVLTVETEMRRGISWRDVFPVVSAIGAVALAIERIY